eukprot:CAMPEP_0119203254 /NCGR_PEP_ID=MMETSP1316-20130426/34155_1 /TAXON_ID=41880 /ORGANISM="Pycnococcus provasolii, Strain RCC2336" /LENGTH=68 /DNA_ID=CAMNT_0007199487 /DNA_START=129 /DNA_END=335 /DNA_ORIENTATION=+
MASEALRKADRLKNAQTNGGTAFEMEIPPLPLIAAPFVVSTKNGSAPASIAFRHIFVTTAVFIAVSSP